MNLGVICIKWYIIALSTDMIVNLVQFRGSKDKVEESSKSSSLNFQNKWR